MENIKDRRKFLEYIGFGAAAAAVLTLKGDSDNRGPRVFSNLGDSSDVERFIERSSQRIPETDSPMSPSLLYTFEVTARPGGNPRVGALKTESYGHCTMISDRYFLTAGHVAEHLTSPDIKNGEPARVTFFYDPATRAIRKPSLIAISRDEDIAMGILESSVNKPENRYWLAAQDPKLGENTRSISYDPESFATTRFKIELLKSSDLRMECLDSMGYSIQPTDLIITDRPMLPDMYPALVLNLDIQGTDWGGRDSYAREGYVVKGTSGAPVFDSNNDLGGLLIEATKRPLVTQAFDGPRYFNKCLTPSVIRRFLQDCILHCG